MLVEDFDDYMTETHSARRAVHCAITAYHLHEWVWGDWLKRDATAQQSMGVRDIKSFLNWIDSKCVWFRAIQDLAQGTKHFIRDQGFRTMRVGAAPFAFDQLTAGFDEGSWDAPLPYEKNPDHGDDVRPFGKGYLLIDYGEGAGEHRWLPAAHLLEVVVRFWRDFFRIYQPRPDLPVSRYHVD